MPIRSISNFVRTPFFALAIVEFAVIFSSVYVAGILLFGSIEACESAMGPMAARGFWIAVVMISGLTAVGLYQFHQRIRFFEIVVRVGVAFAGGSIILAALYFWLPVTAVEPQLAALAVAYSVLLLLLLRLAFVNVMDESVFRRRVIIYGAGEKASAIHDLRRKADRRGFKIVGQVSAPGDTYVGENQGVFDPGTELLSLAETNKADEIVVAMDDRRGNLPIQELLNCKLRGIDVMDLVEFLERESGKIRVDLVNPGWLILTPGFRITRIRRFAKRVLDLLVSGVALLLLWPIMLLVVLAIKIEDGLRAPVLYRQQRVGYHGDVFKVLKFRSMREDAEADGQVRWASKDDDRVTRVGKLIRKIRFDELPQLLNVLRGQMSIVGPRPERPEFVDELSKVIPYYSERHSLKPGITGWAQLKYPYGSSEQDAHEKLQYDLYYVKNHSTLLDLVIMLQTVEVVLWGRGAR